MRTLRIALGTLVCLLLCMGYAASQWAFFHGEAATYSARVDTPSIRLLALAILVTLIVLGMIPNKDDRDIPS